MSMKVLHNDSDAEDQLQEIFQLIWDRAATYDPLKGRPLSWIATLMRRRSIDRLRKRKNYAGPDYNPRVAVLIPAYNEEKVIVRTIRSVMMSNYKNIRVIVIERVCSLERGSGFIEAFGIEKGKANVVVGRPICRPDSRSVRPERIRVRPVTVFSHSPER